MYFMVDNGLSFDKVLLTMFESLKSVTSMDNPEKKRVSQSSFYSVRLNVNTDRVKGRQLDLNLAIQKTHLQTAKLE